MEQEKKVTWLELFYDLAFAALVAQLTYSVTHHHETLFDLMTIGLVGYMIFIAWIGTTVSRNLTDSETTRDKLIVQVQVIGALAMSISLPKVFEGEVAPFFLSYVFIRVIQLCVVQLGYRKKPESKPNTANVFQSMVIATILWIVASFMAAPYLYIIAFSALTLDLIGWLTKGKDNKIRMLNVGHLQERLGLFLIMVIGESVLIISLTNTSVQQGIANPIVVISGVISMIGLWWAYFSHLEKCGSGKRPTNLFAYLHGHAWLYGSVVLFAATYKNLLKHESLLTTDLIMLTASVLIMGAALVTIRTVLQAAHRTLAEAIVSMIIGVPIIATFGFLTNSINITVIMMTAWIILGTMYDEWERKCV